MGLIYKATKLLGDRGEQEVKALFDTGASQCFVRRDVAQAVATLSKGPYPFTFETATGLAKTDEVIFAVLKIDGHDLFWMFYVIPDLSEALIVGADFFQRWKIRLDPEREMILVDPSALRLKLV